MHIIFCHRHETRVYFDSFFLPTFIFYYTHQLDIPVPDDGTELTQVPHQPVENLSNAFPLVAAHFPDTGQLCL